MPSPTSWSTTTDVALSGSQYIDALLYGTRWAGPVITYSFPGYGSSWSTSTTTGYGSSSGTGEPWDAAFSPLSTSDQLYFLAALQQWSNVANLDFSLTGDSSTSVGDIRVAYSTLASSQQAHAYFPSNTATAGDVWINSSSTSATQYWTPGSYENFALLHELGHALGLKHPFSPGGISSVVLPSAYDTQSFSIMSYYSAQEGDTSTMFSYYPTTPMTLDIAAIQYVYGANNSYHTGNNTYSYSDATHYHETIWDAGGTDTIKYTGTQNSSIDLRPGHGSAIGLPVYNESSTGAIINQVNNVWIAYGCTIENATGGSGNDTITGNDANNRLQGGAGNDTLYGGAGNDTFDWDSSSRGGNDTFYGGTGNDTYVLDSANDTVIENAGEGKDTIWADFSLSLGNLPYVENLKAYGTNGGLSLTGNSANNIIQGGSGNDILSGEAGRDRLDGGAGNDTLLGGTGNDTLIGGTGQDTMTGGDGADRFVFRSVRDSAAGANRDVITDFVHGQDKINLSAIDAIAGGGTANDAFQFITGSSFTAAGQVCCVNGILYGNTDANTATSEFQIALPNITYLTASDFIL